MTSLSLPPFYIHLQVSQRKSYERVRYEECQECTAVEVIWLTTPNS